MRQSPSPPFTTLPAPMGFAAPRSALVPLAMDRRTSTCSSFVRGLRRESRFLYSPFDRLIAEQSSAGWLVTEMRKSARELTRRERPPNSALGAQTVARIKVTNANPELRARQSHSKASMDASVWRIHWQPASLVVEFRATGQCRGLKYSSRAMRARVLFRGPE